MKKINFLILFIWLLALNSIAVKAGQITYKLNYDTTKVSIIIYNNGQVEANYDKDLHYNIERVKVPYEYIFFSVPYNATNFHVQFNVDSIINIPITGTLSEQDAVSLAGCVKEVADSLSIMRSFNPESQCVVLTSGYIFGDNKIVQLWISPFTYNSTAEVLRLATDATITLTYDIDSSIVPAVARYDIDTKVADLEIIKPFVVNKSSMMANSYVCNNIISPPQSDPNLPIYNYCIITSRELEPDFKKIIAMKRQKGMSAGVICIEDLMASNVCNGGDNQGNQFPTITDTAGVVRQYLKYAFQCSTTPTRYVLMGGKAPFAPVRYTKSNAFNSNNKNHVSTDMYFSDLSLPWVHASSSFDLQNESEYKFPPNINNHFRLPFYPDIFVGRLLCSSSEDVDNYSDKLYRYLFKPGNGDCSYVSNALFANMLNDNFETMVNKYIDYFEITEHLNNDLLNLTGSQFVNYLNVNRYGYISLHAHGEPQSIRMFEQNNIKYLLTALDRNPMINGNFEENGNGLDCLTNKTYPFICYSNSCTTMPYDKAQSFCGSTQFEDNYNFGASFTLGKNYGGPAYLGNTRDSFGYSQDCLEVEFLKSIYNRKRHSLGVAEALSKVFYKWSTDYNHTMLIHNLLGDPEFEMWTSEPQHYTGITVTRYESGFLFNSGISVNDTIAYCDNDGNIGRIYNRSDYVSLFGISPNSSIMVYNHEHIPYILPLMLQNCNINNSQYVYASSFSAGKSILPNITHGNVTIKNDAVYEVEATDDVHLGEGFIVENGATFAIKTPGKVTIDGCVFQSGAKVKIEAGNIEIAGKFTAEHGSVVEFTQFVE